MKNTLKVFIGLLIISINTQFIYAELPGYTCKIHGKIVGFDEYFIKPDCFKLTKLRIKRDNGIITEFTAVTKYHETCFKAYFDGGYQVQDVLTLPQFIPDYKQYGKTYFFKVEEATFGKVYVYTGGIDKTIASIIPIDNIGEIPVNSIMSGYYKDNSSDINNLPECDGYNIGNTETIKVVKTENTNRFVYKYLIFGAIIGLISGLILALLYKKQNKQKK
ncbi:hypothetical protein EOM39_02790 [Candidatus Gracilibacteria bacterium]|nr:hypothetical protein [Candidatus Gracilibacteria bacterium]